MKNHPHPQPSQGKTLRMRPFLATSVVLNLTVGAWALSQYFQQQQQEQNASAPAAPAPAHILSVVPTSASVPAITATVSDRQRLPSQSSPSAKFHWKQLESESYDTYIARLREVGCPECTIKDIVTGELKADSADKRAELERRILHSTDWSPPPGVSRQDYLASQLRKLDREIDITAGNLMQSSAAATPGSSTAATSSGDKENKPPVQYPAVLGDVTFQPSTTEQVRYVDAGVVEVPQKEMASIREIQENFVQEIGGPNQDAEDPQYEKNWRAAQSLADQVFRARYGWGAYGDLQRATAQKAHEQSQKASAGN